MPVEDKRAISLFPAVLSTRKMLSSRDFSPGPLECRAGSADVGLNRPAGRSIAEQRCSFHQSGSQSSVDEGKGSDTKGVIVLRNGSLRGREHCALRYTFIVT